MNLQRRSLLSIALFSLLALIALWVAVRSVGASASGMGLGTRGGGIAGINGAPCGFATITGALSTAQDGDLILIEQGLYNSVRLNNINKSVTLAPAVSGTSCQTEYAGSSASTLVIDGGGGTSSASGGFAQISGGATVTFRHITVRNTTATNGGLFAVSGGSTLVLDGSTVRQGTATGDGGLIHVSGAGSQVQVTDFSAVQGGSAENGGGIYLGNGSLTITNSSVSGNNASDSGGSVYASSAIVDVGSGGSVATSTADSTGGGIYADDSTVTISGSLSGNNAASLGGGIALFGTSTLSATGTIFANNQTAASIFETGGGGIFAGESAEVTLHGALVQLNSTPNEGGGLYAAASATVVITGSTVISENTAFAGAGVFAREPVFGGGGALSLTIHGSTIGSNSATSEGGGMYLGDVDADVTDTSIRSNSATRGGGLYMMGGSLAFAGGGLFSNTGSADGGGLYLSGTQADIDSAEVNSNVASGVSVDTGFGGGFYGASANFAITNTLFTRNVGETGGGFYIDNATITVSDSTIMVNAADSGGGFAIAETGVVTVTNGKVDGNAASVSGGGIFNEGQLTIRGASVSDNIGHIAGGGIANNGSSLHVEAATIEGNTLTVSRQAGGSSGGGIAHSSGTATVISATVAANSADFGSGIYASGGTVTISNTHIISHTNVNGFGGGIYNSNSTLSLDIVTLAHNSAFAGAGIVNRAQLSIHATTIAENQVGDSGGGILNESGTLTITASAIYSNTATQDGGGIFSEGGVSTLINSTLSSNVANRNGGGLAAIAQAKVNMTNLTISGNAATQDGGGIFRDNGDLDFRNVIVANSPSGADCHLLAGSAGFSNSNLIEDGSCLTGATLAADPVLGPLADNGGPTLTHALLPNSPARDVGSNFDAVLPFDQRGPGFDRNSNGTVDLGAFEYAFTCPSPPYLVNDELTWREAIACYNSTTVPGTVEVLFSASLFTGVSFPAINNAVSGVHLRIIGNGNTFNALNQRRVLDIQQGHVTVDNLMMVSGNAGSFFPDGGVVRISSNGVVTITNSTVADGVAENGGGIFNDGITSIFDTTVENNSAKDDGGGILNGFGAHLTIDGSTINGNTAGFQGGGIYNASVVTMTQTIVSDNMADHAGGGLRNVVTMSVQDSTISGNSSGTDGGGIFAGFRFSMEGSTVSGNTATDEGGGLYQPGTRTSAINSTFSGNSASYGGGIANVGTMTITHVTIAFNTVITDGGGIYLATGDTVNSNNSLVAQNTSPGVGGDCLVEAGGFLNNFFGANLDTDGTCGTFTTGVASLGPLTDNSGPTLTHMLGSNSDALDAGEGSICAAVGNVDQRGFLRNDGACDLGAVERDASVPTAIDLRNQAVEAGLPLLQLSWTIVAILVFAIFLTLKVMTIESQCPTRTESETDPPSRNRLS